VNSILWVAHDAGDKLRGLYINGKRMDGVLSVEPQLDDAQVVVTLHVAQFEYESEPASSV
jgi:hypothetical protein